MAEFQVVQSFKASHDIPPKEKNFRIEVVVEGPIDPENEYAAGIDFFEVLRELNMILAPLRGKYLRPIMNKEGFKTSVLEAMGVFFFRKLKEKKEYPIKSVTIWENDILSATVFAEDCGFNR